MVRAGPRRARFARPRTLIVVASRSPTFPPVSSTTYPVIAVTAGDPGGVGPEVVVKALAAERRAAQFVILGPRSALAGAAKAAGIRPFWAPIDGPAPRGRTPLLIDTERRPRSAAYPARPNAQGGRVSFECVRTAVDLARAGIVDAVVTAPISKKAWELAGHGEFPGHTELLASACGVRRFAMFFHAPATRQGPGLNVILATVHVPLARVPSMLTAARIVETISLGHEAVRSLGVLRPRIAVCGLNPHAGEGGLLGEEDDRVIAPAIAKSRRAGIDASGPYPADTVFQRALSRVGTPAEFDLVVAMYHDQGLIALKTLAWDRAVNMTVGLPIVRTSPDHGTAFDIAGKNRADAGSMRAAIALAVRMAAGRRP